MGASDPASGCLICGTELTYLDEPRELECAICHKTYVANVCCTRGHYVCDTCHTGDAVPFIKGVCLQTGSRDPFDILMKIMSAPCIHMHGPEHHVLVGSALIAAYHNCGGDIDLEQALDEMARRGQQVPGGACGFWGSCGAAISAGMFVSIVTGSTPLKTEEWGLSNLMTSAALQAIGSVGGPRCCKRDSFLATREAVAFCAEHLGVGLDEPDKVICRFSPSNRQCLGARCPFNPDHAGD